MENSTKYLNKHHRFVHFMRVLLMGMATILFILLLVWPQIAKKSDLLTNVLKNPVNSKDLQTEIDITKVQFFSEDMKGQPFTISSDKITEIDASKKIIQLDDPKAEMTFSSGIKLFSSAPLAWYYQETQIIFFKEKIDVLSDNNYHADMRNVIVDYKNQLAYSNNHLRLRGEKLDLDSAGFYVRQNGSEVDLKGPINIVFKDPERNVILTAEKVVEIRQKTQTVTAFENVVVDDGTNKVFCDELTAYFKQTGKNQYELQSIQAQKNVEIKTLNEKITGNEAFYDMVKERAFITGDVVVERAEGTIQGDRAIIDMKSGVSQLEVDYTKQTNKKRVKGTLLPLQLKKKE